MEMENLFPITIGDEHMEFLIDLLVLPEGPRLRDKVSHGEVDLDEDMSNSVFRMCIYIIIASYIDLSRYLSPTLEDSSSSSLSDYRALFHPKRLLIDEVDEVAIGKSNFKFKQFTTRWRILTSQLILCSF